MNEEAVRKAIKRSGVRTDEIFVTTKLWIQDAGYDSTQNAFRKSLQRLQMEYLDLYLNQSTLSDRSNRIQIKAR